MAKIPNPIVPKMKPQGTFIFMSRWLPLPLYLGLIVAQAIVSRLHLETHPDQPEWLEHVDVSVLMKVKQAMSIALCGRSMAAAIAGEH